MGLDQKPKKVHTVCSFKKKRWSYGEWSIPSTAHRVTKLGHPPFLRPWFIDSQVPLVSGLCPVLGSSGTHKNLGPNHSKPNHRSGLLNCVWDLKLMGNPQKNYIYIYNGWLSLSPLNYISILGYTVPNFAETPKSARFLVRNRPSFGQLYGLDHLECLHVGGNPLSVCGTSSICCRKSTIHFSKYESTDILFLYTGVWPTKMDWWLDFPPLPFTCTHPIAEKCTRLMLQDEALKVLLQPGVRRTVERHSRGMLCQCRMIKWIFTRL